MASAVKDKKLNNLKSLRVKLDLKQEDVALLLGCKRATYGCKENGKIEISRSEMIKIRNYFNKLLVKRGLAEVTLDDIFLP